MIGLFIVIVILGVIGLFCFAGWYAIGTAVNDGRKVKQLAAQPGPVLDELFDGSPQVVYAPHARHGGLPIALLVQGANQHGYRFVSESGRMATRTVIFTKV